MQDGKPAHALEWLALTAWSCAIEASQQAEMQQAALLMAASGELWAAHQQPSPAVLSKQKVVQSSSVSFSHI